jgi:putative endonuclease
VNTAQSNPEEGRWSVYLLSCADGTLYCGVTTDVARRIAMHNGDIPGGAKYTRGRRPVTLAACAEGMSRGEALSLETRIKKLPKKDKLPALQHAAGHGAGPAGSVCERKT